MRSDSLFSSFDFANNHGISNNPRDPEESTEDHYDLVTVKYVYDLVADLSKNG